MAANTHQRPTENTGATTHPSRSRLARAFDAASQHLRARQLRSLLRMIGAPPWRI